MKSKTTLVVLRGLQKQLERVVLMAFLQFQGLC